MSSTLVSAISVTCRSDICSVWGFLTDTERMNRAMGMQRVSVEPLSDASAARYLVSTQLAGIPVEYEERPFEWVFPRRFRVLRRMRSGPVDSLEVTFELEPLDDGTKVTITIGLAPRFRVLSPFLRLATGLTLKDFEKTIRREDDALQAGKPALVAARRGAVHGDAFERAEAALRKSEGGPVADRLLAYLREAGDADVSRIRPFALADEWKTDRSAVLGLCLAAVRAGLLDLRWEVVCPSCRTASEVLPSLASLSEHGACQLCELEFAMDLEEAVEATFAPARAVREVDAGPYCIGGPARTPHVLAQAILPAGGEGALATPAEEGRYRLFVRGGKATPVEVKAGAPGELCVDELGGPLEVAPEGSIRVKNPAADERHAKLERLAWVDQAARARVVTAMPGFRRDFSNDILRPGLALRVARMALFFSDLTGSTQLYTNAGDAAAFKLVHDHFDVVIGLVEKHRGTLVKTIGDAVMAVFPDDLDGLLASVAILHAFEEFRRDDPHRQQTHIKLGVFAGSCYVVTANGILDYFGQTVNIAARLQGEAKSGELVVEESLAERAIEARALPRAFVVERYEARLKGVAAPVRVARIRVGQVD